MDDPNSRKETRPTYIISSDSDDDVKIFGTRKKRKIDSSEDEYDPSPAKKKIKKSETKNVSPKKPRKQTVLKEKKPKAERKKPVRKPKQETTDASNEHISTDAVQGTSKMEAGPAQIHAGPSSVQDMVKMEWNEAEYVAQLQQIDIRIAQNVMRLLDEDNTIPFIARYRKEHTNDMSPEKLREVKASYDMVKTVKQKASTVEKSIAKLGKLTPLLERSIRCARSISELDHIYSPFKPGSKHTLAERARQLGLEEPANDIMNGTKFVLLEQYVKPTQKGVENVKNVELGIQHIIADVISKDREVLDLLRRLREDANIRLETKKARATKDSQKSKPNEEKKKVKTEGDHKPHKDKTIEEDKFKDYFQFCMPVRNIKPYQVLAVNRAENLKILTVKIIVPEWILLRLRDFCRRRWSKGTFYPLRSKIFELSIDDAYARLIEPLIIRQVRTELTQKAEHAAVDVFAVNLKQLLLTPPFRGKTVLGIDPGFRMGCKLGVTSATGSVLATDVIYPQFGKFLNPEFDNNAQKLKDILTKFSCDVIALGNGTACREMETYLSELIKIGWFRPLDLQFTIVSEQGASIYSCSPVAKKEFPDMDPNRISAVSLARRLQDPLGELVKVEPKHLGVGMYQHDVPEKMLSSTLDEIVVECVSFVGVDVNIASDCLLRRVAGLNSARAQKIIEWRTTNGSFINRQQILKVKGIGAKTFEQCAGFIRINPQTSQRSQEKPPGSTVPKKMRLSDDSDNPLDRTWIHPESYSVASRFIEKCKVNLEDLGTPNFIAKVKEFVTRSSIKSIADELSAPEAVIKLICEGLQQTPDHDLRSQFQDPLFRRGVTSMEDVIPGSILKGRAENVTHFGTFVDIGVGRSGLIPASRLGRARPQLGDRIEVKVHAVDLKRQRITLDLVRIL